MPKNEFHLPVTVNTAGWQVYFRSGEVWAPMGILWADMRSARQFVKELADDDAAAGVQDRPYAVHMVVSVSVG